MEPPKNYLIDMDGVLITGGTMIPGADAFLARLKAREAKFLILTNNSRYTPGDLSHRLHGDRPGASALKAFSRRPWQPPASCRRSARTAPRSSSATAG